jgi:hypothetical protein
MFDGTEHLPEGGSLLAVGKEVCPSIQGLGWRKAAPGGAKPGLSTEIWRQTVMVPLTATLPYTKRTPPAPRVDTYVTTKVGAAGASSPTRVVVEAGHTIASAALVVLRDELENAGI